MQMQMFARSSCVFTHSSVDHLPEVSECAFGPTFTRTFPTQNTWRVANKALLAFYGFTKIFTFFMALTLEHNIASFTGSQSFTYRRCQFLKTSLLLHVCWTAAALWLHQPGGNITLCGLISCRIIRVFLSCLFWFNSYYFIHAFFSTHSSSYLCTELHVISGCIQWSLFPRPVSSL